jgi:hypothetical protein
MNSNSGKLAALALALDYADLRYDEVHVDKLVLAGDMLGVCYEIEFTTACLRYFCYVDVFDGEVVGFLTVPELSEKDQSTAA